MSRPIPELQTPRLILRAHRQEDLPACVALWSDPEVTRYTIGSPSPAQRTWMRILGYLGHWELMGFGYWAVEEKASGLYIGELGYADFKREIDPAFAGLPEMGWALATQAQGKGHATEALLAAAAWGDAHLPSPRTFCLIHPDNTRSLRVASKLGFRTCGQVNLGGVQEIVLDRSTRSDAR